MADPSNLFIVGNESYFNEDARFYKDVYIYGILHYDFKASGTVEFDSLTVLNNSSFYGDVSIAKDLNVGNNVGIGSTLGVGKNAYFNESVFIRENLDVGIVTVRKKLDVGINGRTLTAQVGDELIGDGQVGIGSTQPEQKFDVIGNVKFSAQMYDSLNSPGALGAFLTKDRQGIKWTIFEP